ncbi:DUF4360 domain-containing protein [Massilia genomosp. 1]|nr:DUF4360 domain-containing protein [Massilia genomosp. 1]
MRLHMKILLACGAALTLPAYGAQDGCPAGSYSVVVSPDRTTLSILFDKFHIDTSTATSAVTAGAASKVCHILHSLNLPANMSLGVYKVDYRGFAKLASSQEASLEVQYALAPQGNEHGRVFRRKVKGVHEGDYIFTENIGAGQMKRIGCGIDAKLNVRIKLGLSGGADAMVSLDSSDGTTAAMVYHLDVKKCN